MAEQNFPDNTIYELNNLDVLRGMEDQNSLLPGWKLDQAVLSVEFYNIVLTVRVATLGEARLAVMDFQDLLEDQEYATVASFNPGRNGMDRRGYLVEIHKEGEPTAVHMMTDYPDENSEPDLRWLGSHVWAGQALVEFYPMDDTQEQLAPEDFVVEDRREP